jgi:hypothetical protein
MVGKASCACGFSALQEDVHSRVACMHGQGSKACQCSAMALMASGLHTLLHHHLQPLTCTVSPAPPPPWLQMGTLLSPRLTNLAQPASPSRLSRQDLSRASFGSTSAGAAAAAAAVAASGDAPTWAARALAPAAPSPLAASQASSLAEQPSGSTQHTAARMDRWLRNLLHELMGMLCTMADVPEPVWTAAAGCLVHLTTHGGHFVCSRADAAPPAALAKLLRCCRQYTWSDELYCQLVRLTVNVLYDPDPSAVDASMSSNGYASGVSAAGLGQLQQREAAGLDSGAALSQQRLAEFGGLAELVQHFCTAPVFEAQANLLTVILHSLVPPDAGDDSTAALVAALCGSPAALATLQGVLRAAAGDAAAAPMDGLLTVLSQNLEGVDMQLASTVLLRLEAAALEGARDLREAATDLEPVMEATAQLVGGSSSGSGMDVQQAWRALRDLAASKEPLARQLACNWLQRLLLAAFDPRAGTCPVPSIETATRQTQEVAQQLAAARSTSSQEVDVDPAVVAQQHLAAALLQLLAAGAPAAEVLLDAVEQVSVHIKAGMLHSSSGSLGGSSSSSKRELLGGHHRRSGSSTAGEQQQRQLAAQLVSELWGNTAQWVCRCMATAGGASSSGGAPAGSSGAAAAARRELAVFSRLGDLLVRTLCTAVPMDQLPEPGYMLPLASTSVDQLSDVAEHEPALAVPPTALQAARLFLYGHTHGWVNLLHTEAVYGIVEVLARVQELGGSFSAATCGFQGRPSRCPAPHGQRAGAEVPPGLASVSQDPLRGSGSGPGRQHPARGSNSSTSTSLQHQRLRGGTSSGGIAGQLRSPRGLPHTASVGSDLGGGGSVVSAASSNYREASSMDAGSSGDGLTPLDRMTRAPWVDDFTDSQLALLLLLLGFCGMDGAAVVEFGVEELLKVLLGSRDVRQRYYSALYLLKHMMLNQAERYWQALRQLVLRAQSANDEKVLGNPYLQISAMIDSL